MCVTDGACKEEDLGTFVLQYPELSFTAQTINVPKNRRNIRIWYYLQPAVGVKSDTSWITFTTSISLVRWEQPVVQQAEFTIGTILSDNL
ncbi:MAG: hypothetical protein JNL03_13155 [Prolixibacteraceae bacterium]|nr:hypothetical protein [Prolixibacteraceae bacterium]